MVIVEQTELGPLTTMAASGCSRYFAEAGNADTLRALIRHCQEKHIRWQILGGGSNVVFNGNFDGMVIRLTMKGRQRCGSVVTASAGEGWDEFVAWTLDQGLSGLENLSLIPGTVGAAPVQNIGAYGVELAELMDRVQVYYPESDAFEELSRADCQFAYRDSIFKKELVGRAVIVSVTFSLRETFLPRLDYPILADQFSVKAPQSAAEVRAAVIRIRQRRLPDPAVIPNAGSFFKNPLISAADAQRLISEWPDIPVHASPEGDFKLSAAWLIDQAGCKRLAQDGVKVSDQHALVLTNPGRASGAVVLALATEVQQRVSDRFGISLEIEPVVIS
ncbi:MAG: UDP-N-acetylmuramate dehydrogenase [Pseudomonadales bacterium]|nr:UDP-N-acetylmuramate dehydrogenase [Pseudomonadales bacterium]